MLNPFFYEEPVLIYQKDGVIVSKIKWDAPTERTDGTPYGAIDHKGYELGVWDGEIYSPWISIPASYDILEWPLDQLNMTEEKTYQVALRTVDLADRISVWSDPVIFVASYAQPNAPQNVAVT